MKAAIVGCGSIASIHAECIKKMTEHQLVAFADIKINRAEDFAVKYGGNAYSTLDEMLEKEKVDVIHICTPHYLHAPMAIKCLLEGKYVFVEKPTVINDIQWNDLKKANNNKRIGFCFQNRYQPCVKKVLEMIASKAAGKILGIRGYVTWSRDEAYYTESDWRGSIKTEGGGALINQSIHTLDLMDYIMGEKAVSIDAVIANHHLKGIIEVEDAMSAHIKYNDSIASFYACTSYIDNLPPIIELCCENMRIRIEDMDITLYHKGDRKEVISLEGKQGLGKSWWGACHEDCIRDFYECILEDKKFKNDIEGIEKITELMLGAYKSAYTGKTVML